MPNKMYDIEENSTCNKIAAQGVLVPLRTLAPFVREHSLLSTVHNILKMEVEQSLSF